MKIDKKYLWIILPVLSIALVVIIQVVRHSLREEERQARIHIRQAVKKKFPEAVKRVKATYGLALLSYLNFRKSVMRKRLR